MFLLLHDSTSLLGDNQIQQNACVLRDTELLTCLQAARNCLGLLPMGMWAKVASHLRQDDILTMRQVSRQFRSLASLQDLQLDWNIQDGDAAASLALFCMRNCSRGPTPRLHITIGCGDLGQSWPSLMLALHCSSLRALHLESWELILSQAEMLLQCVPSQLATLKLATVAIIVNDPSWQRLSALSHLSHYVSSLEDIHFQGTAGSGIAALPSLKLYEFDMDQSWHNQFVVFNDRFMQRSVEKMILQCNPFCLRTDFAEFSNLQEVHLLDDPANLFQHQPLEHVLLSMPNARAWSRVIQEISRDAQKLRYKRLTFDMMDPETPLEVLTFLEMPDLSVLSIMAVHVDAPACQVILRGSLEHYEALLDKVEMQITGAAKVELHQSDHPSIQDVALKSNGHGVICMCWKCRER